MLKDLAKDSVVYAAANAVQKLGPFVTIPLVITYLGRDAFKVYDVSFVSAYTFAWLVVLGQDVAASLLYFDSRRQNNDRRSVIAGSLVLQLGFLAVLALCFLPLKGVVSAALYAKDADVARWWSTALLVLPGQVLYYQALNVLLWQRRRKAYVLLCLVQTCAVVAGVPLAVVVLHGGLALLFYVLIGAASLSGLVGLFLVRHTVFVPLSFVTKDLLKKLLVLGLPFGLTAFFQQLVPSVDRFFLLHFNRSEDLAAYALAAKLGTLVSFGTSAFVLAFTPYSMSRLNNENAEEEIAGVFRVVSVVGFLAVPFLLFFKDLLVGLFANASYGVASTLLPFFFFGWVFDMFGAFTLLGIYRSQKSSLSLLLFTFGLVLIAVFNLVLIPLLGVYGAALSFALCKACLFFVSLVKLKKHFHLRLHTPSFFPAFLLAVVCSYLIYVLPLAIAAMLTAGLLLLLLWFVKREGHLTLLPGSRP